MLCDCSLVRPKKSSNEAGKAVGARPCKVTDVVDVLVSSQYHAKLVKCLKEEGNISFCILK